MQIIDKKTKIYFLLIFNLSFAVNAQTVINPDSALQTILNNLNGTSLTLSQAREYAAKNSALLKQAEAVYLEAKGTLRREKGNFDPEFFFNINYESQKIPQASFFAGADILSTQQTEAAAGLRLNLPIGTKLELLLNTTKLKTNSGFAFLNPEYDAFGSITLRQPLLSGFAASGSKDLKQAELNLETAKAQYDQAVLNTNVAVEQAYWNLYTAARNYAVQELTPERAEAVLKEAQLHFKAGLAGPNQVANAKTFWAEQKLLLIDRDEQFDAQSDQLAALIGKRPENSDSRFLAADNPPSDFPIEPVLVTKNAILIVEFANQQRTQGHSFIDSVVKAATIRLRPILMTSFTTIFGILPIAIGLGAGAECRRPLGLAVVGGMLFSTFLTLIIVPVVYTLLARFTSKEELNTKHLTENNMETDSSTGNLIPEGVTD